jgi:8-oxo-dGTP pyrophosphatase MutT (NUDIX family)
VEALCDELDDAAASARLGIARGGLAYWVAAVRETFEEAGVLFARHADDGRAFDPREPGRAERLAADRRSVDAGQLRLADVVRRAGLHLAVGAMHYAARWITPVGPPRRYDTRFFVTALPRGQTPVPDRREAVHSEWVRPAEALVHFEAGERAMLPPTVGMLRILASYDRSEQVVAAALRDETGPDRGVRLVGDVAGGGGWRVLLPGEESAEGERVHDIQAWVRLRARPAEE